MQLVNAFFPLWRNSFLAWLLRIQSATVRVKASNSHFFKLIRWEFVVLNVTSFFRPDILTFWQAIHLHQVFLLFRSSIRDTSSGKHPIYVGRFLSLGKTYFWSPSLDGITHFWRLRLAGGNFVGRLEKEGACFLEPALVYSEFWTRDRWIVVRNLIRQH